MLVPNTLLVANLLFFSFHWNLLLGMTKYFGGKIIVRFCLKLRRLICQIKCRNQEMIMIQLIVLSIYLYEHYYIRFQEIPVIF